MWRKRRWSRRLRVAATSSSTWRQRQASGGLTRTITGQTCWARRMSSPRAGSTGFASSSTPAHRASSSMGTTWRAWMNPCLTRRTSRRTTRTQRRWRSSSCSRPTRRRSQPSRCDRTSSGGRAITICCRASSLGRRQDNSAASAHSASSWTPCSSRTQPRRTCWRRTRSRPVRRAQARLTSSPTASRLNCGTW